MNVLFVDDEPSILDQAKIFLEKEHSQFNIITALSPKEALKSIEKRNYDAIVSDYQMPEMDGLEFLKTLRENNKNLPFIVFTGRGREEVAMEALNLGADRYFQKGGEPRSQYGVLADAIIQEVKHREAENKLKKSERKFRKSFEASPDPVFLLDKEGVFQDANRAATKKLGYSKDEIIGSSLRKAPFLSKKSAEKAVENFKRRKKGEKIPPYIIELKKKDGENILTEVNVGTFEENGEFSGEIVIARDITKLKRTEEIISDVASSMISSVDPDELLQTIVENARKISGAKFVSLSLYDEERKTVKLKAVSGGDSSLLEKISSALGVNRLIEKEYPTHKCERFEKFLEKTEKEPVILEDFHEYTFGLFDKKICNSIQDMIGIKEIVAIPLLKESRLIGLMCYLFSSEDEKRNSTPLMIFADFASQAIEKSNLSNQTN